MEDQDRPATLAEIETEFLKQFNEDGATARLIGSGKFVITLPAPEA